MNRERESPVAVDSLGQGAQDGKAAEEDPRGYDKGTSQAVPEEKSRSLEGAGGGGHELTA